MLKRLCPSLRKNTFPSLGHSCKEIRNADSHVKDGEYWIDLKKNGNLSKVYCDMETEGGKERIFKKNIKITVLFLLLPKPSFYNKWNAISFCKIKNLISFHFFFPGGWLLVSNVVVDNLSLLQFSEESSYHEISKCHDKSLLLTTDAMKELRTHLSFTQLRFHCSKKKGRTLHLTTAANSRGEAVVQYFSGQTDARPGACGSFVRMKDDNSKIAADCNQWGNKQWGYSDKGVKRYRVVAYISGKYYWYLLGSLWECDDYNSNNAEFFGLSTGDFWRIFVR